MRAKSFLIKILVGVCLVGTLGVIPSGAQSLYNTFYWINGQVQAPPGESVPTDNRMVVFYETTPEAGYAADFSGAGGLSGRPNEFMLNAMDDWRMAIAPGTYKIAIVKGTDNYGMNPKDVTVSGQGYDSAGTLVLAYGEGIGSPEARGLPPNLASEIPYIERIWFDNKLYQRGLVARGKETVIAEQPEIKVRIIAGIMGIDTNSFLIVADPGTINEKTYTVTPSHITRTVGTPLPTEIEYVYDFATEAQTLTNGNHALRFTAGNSVGTTIEVANVNVIGGPARLIGLPLTYPSPLRLTQNNQVVFQYGLSKDRNVDIHVFDLTGQQVKVITCNAGTAGGSAGGEANPNKVVWNLITDQGTKIGSGIYIWYLVDRDDNRTLGKGKLAIAP